MEHVNVGTMERAIRIIIGVVVFALGMMQVPPAWWGWLGIVPLATGLAGYCPLWAALGVSTARAS
jgi:cadmium resistance protein CadD (predicted permease)